MSRAMRDAESTHCKRGHAWEFHGILRESRGKDVLTCGECMRIQKEDREHPMPVLTDEQRTANLARFNADMQRVFPGWPGRCAK